MQAVPLSFEMTENSLPFPTLFIHGNLASSRWWIPTLRELKNISKNASSPAVLADWRGCGTNPDWSSDRLFSIEELANDYNSLLDKLKLDKVNLVGHSLGGLIGVVAMAQRPERFARTVLLDPVGATGVVFDQSMYDAFKAMAVDRNLTGQVIGGTIYNNPLGKSELDPIIDDAFKAVKGIGSSVLEILKTVDVRDRLDKIKTPTLVLFGEEDKILSAEDARKLSESLPEGQFEMVPNQGHCWNVEHPTSFARRVWTYLYG